jgi:hypothetical protein
VHDCAHACRLRDIVSWCHPQVPKLVDRRALASETRRLLRQAALRSANRRPPPEPLSVYPERPAADALHRWAELWVAALVARGAALVARDTAQWCTGWAAARARYLAHSPDGRPALQVGAGGGGWQRAAPAQLHQQLGGRPRAVLHCE